jgi:hypothetical protein
MQHNDKYIFKVDIVNIFVLIRNMSYKADFYYNIILKYIYI